MSTQRMPSFSINDHVATTCITQPARAGNSHTRPIIPRSSLSRAWKWKRLRSCVKKVRRKGRSSVRKCARLGIIMRGQITLTKWSQPEQASHGGRHHGVARSVYCRFGWSLSPFNCWLMNAMQGLIHRKDNGTTCSARSRLAARRMSGLHRIAFVNGVLPDQVRRLQQGAPGDDVSAARSSYWWWLSTNEDVIKPTSFVRSIRPTGMVGAKPNVELIDRHQLSANRQCPAMNADVIS